MSEEELLPCGDCEEGEGAAIEEAQAARSVGSPPKITRIASLTNNFWDTSLPDGKDRFKAMVDAYVANFPEDWPDGPPWVPTAPTDLQYSVSSSAVILTWIDMSDTETGFTIIKHNVTDSLSVPITLPANTSMWSDVDVEIGKTYVYSLASFNSNGMSLFDTTEPILIPEIPQSGDALDEFDVEVDVSGQVFMGVPFKKGVLTVAAMVVIDSPGGPLVGGVIEPLEKWGDGSVKWARLAFPATEAGVYNIRVIEEEMPPPAAAPEITPNSQIQVTLNGEILNLAAEATEANDVYSEVRAEALSSEKIETTLWTRQFLDGSTRSFLRFVNKNPTDTNSQGSQPMCSSFGNAADRSLNVTVSSDQVINVRRADVRQVPTGATSIDIHTSQQHDLLRAGEGRIWELTTGTPAEPPIALCEASRYIDSEVTDPIAEFRSNVPATLNYELNMIVGIDTIYSNRNSKPKWENCREDGEDQRDWDGGTPDDVQTHNDEYETNYGYFLQALRTARVSDSLMIGDISRKAYLLGETGASHHAVVDLYDVQEGPLRWMWGAVWQHTKHGGAGNGNMHRSSYPPNTGHFNGRSLKLAWLLSGNPACFEGFETLSDTVMWKVENNHGMPGISDVKGAARNASNLLGLALEWYQFADDKTRIDAVIHRIIEEQTARSAYDPNTTSKYKPWQVSTYIHRLLACRDIAMDYGNDVLALRANDAIIRCTPALEDSYVGPTQTEFGIKPAHCMYQKNPDNDSNACNMWDMVAGDVLTDLNPTMAEELWDTGTRYIWYWDRWGGSDVGEYARLLQHTVSNVYGGRMMKRLHNA